MTISLATLAGWDQHEAYFLAGWPCEQGLRTIFPAVRALRAPGRPTAISRSEAARLERLVVADIGSGSGVFGQRVKLIDPSAYTIGLEIRDDERAAARHYDRWLEGDVFAAEDELRSARPHVIVGNPAFSLTLKKLQLALRCVRVGGFVLFIVRADWGQAEDAWDFLDAHPPLDEFEIGGRPQFRSGQKPDGEDWGTDWAGAKWLLFRRGHVGTAGQWVTKHLPRLPSASLSWSERPGTEIEPSPLPPAFWPQNMLEGVL